MYPKYRMRGIIKAIAMFITAISFTANISAINDDMTVIDGIRYRTDFLPSSYRTSTFGDDGYTEYTLENMTKAWTIATRDLCKAGGDYNTFLFDDGSEFPAFMFSARVIKSNSSYHYSRLPIKTEKIDSIANRYPYYTGEVWLQDSVLMQALPNLKEKKYHLVCDIDRAMSHIYGDRGGDYYYENEEAAKLFDGGLTFIRTPRYAVVRTGTFRDQAKLKIARIGAVQYVACKAFENCPKLETVYFERSPYVDDQAFCRCNNIKYIVVNCKLPEIRYSVKIEADRSPFDLPVYEKATLYVPGDQIQAYRNDKVWGKFKNIKDIEEYTSGVETICQDSVAEYRIYNLSGIQIRTAKSGEDWREGLPTGMYIVKSSLGSTRKEYIK